MRAKKLTEFDVGNRALAWLPLQSLAVKKKQVFFVLILGGEKLLKLVEKYR